MNGPEALTYLIAMSDELIGLHSSHRPVMEEQTEREKLAVSVGQAMLNTMLPIARFRLHVEVTPHGIDKKLEWTVCALTPDELRMSIIGLSMEKAAIYITLWEQRPMGAEMLAGFQGETKTLKFRTFLKALDNYTEPTKIETMN